MVARASEIHQIIEKADSAERSQDGIGLLECLAPVWKYGEAPDLAAYDADTEALLLRRIGFCEVLVGRRVNNGTTQARGRMRIEEAIRIFESPLNLEGCDFEAAEARSVLAYCYIIKGDTTRALKLIERADETLRRNSDSYEYLRNQANRMNVLSWLGKARSARGVFEAIYDSVQRLDDDFFKAWFDSKAGGIFHFAQDYTTSLEFYRRSIATANEEGFFRLAAINLNNVALILRKTGDFRRAHENVRESYSIFRKLDEKDGLAHVLDTEAQIFLDEGRIEDAENTIDLALGLFREADLYAGQADSMLIKIEILLRGGNTYGAIALSEELRELVYTKIGIDGYAKFGRLLDDVLGSYDVKDNQAIMIDQEIDGKWRSLEHSAFETMIRGEKHVVVAIRDGDLEKSEKHIVKCLKSGRYFYGSLNYDEQLDIFHVDHRPIRSAGFEVYGRVVADYLESELPDR